MIPPCRPGQKNRARYYAVVTLNQMVLSHNSAKGGAELPRKLVDIYFTLFRLVLDKEIGVAAELKAAHEAKGEDGGKSGKEGKDGKGTEPKASRKPKHGATLAGNSLCA